MTRKECERAIAEKLREIWDIYREYAPGGGHLTTIVTDHSTIVFNADSVDGGEKPLDYYSVVEEVGADASDEW
jgi:hypothetical protein